MAKKKIDIPVDNDMREVLLEEAMPDNFLPYAIEVAKDRALPDVRDGLKPVHRRILYGSYLLKALPDKPYYKSARIVGDILGKFHPHGDSSVYDAMVIMAQDFSTREPLFDGHGNFGSIDGDSAAAMRYTEARLSNIALELIGDIDKNTVDFVPNYSDSEMEPTVLPAKYPNLLVNGAFGIAVGLATNIPPHNLGEVIDGTCAYIDNPEISTRELMEYIKAPDLPTGGELIGKNSLLSAYETGEGKVALRAKTSIETLDNGRLAIVIHEFPYKENKASLLQTISDMTGDERHKKSLKDIADIRDESDRTGIRAVIEFKKNVTLDVVDKHLKYLLKKTNLQKNISFNMVALANRKPETLSLKAIIGHYVNHQKDVVTRRTKCELEVAKKRFHIVEGFIKAIDIMDDLVATIRASKSKKDSKDNIIAKYGFSEEQAEAIVTLMLYRLTSLEISEFMKEYKKLDKEIKRLEKILSKEKALLDLIKKELLEIKDKYQSPRRTVIVEDEKAAVINIEETIIDEEVVVTLSKDGFIKRVAQKTYSRTNPTVDDIEYREGDYCEFIFNSNTKNDLVVFTESAQMYKTKVINIPEAKWKDKGNRISEIISSLDYEKEKVVNIMDIQDFTEDKKMVFITANGYIKEISFEKFKTSYAKSMATKVRPGDYIVGCYLVDKNSDLMKFHIETSKGFVFTIEEPVVDLSEKNILPVPFVNMIEGDTIKEITLYEGSIDEEISLYITEDFIVKNGFGRKVLKDDYIFAVTEDAKVYVMSSYMFAGTEEVDLKEISNDKIVGVFFVDGKLLNYECVYFFTELGMIKKSKCSEFVSTNVSIGCKLKENDRIVNAFSGSMDESELFIFTKEGKVLRFKDEVFTATGKMAGAITGIKLKNNDSVIFGFAQDDEGLYDIKVNGNKKAIDLESIEYKNKGTMGVTFDKKIKEVSFVMKK